MQTEVVQQIAKPSFQQGCQTQNRHVTIRCMQKHSVMEEFRCYEVKIEESEKASSCQESTPGNLWLAFVCITFFYMTLLLKMMWCTFNTSISHTQLMMLTKISHCQYCILNTSLHINILMSFTVDHELQSIHRNHSYLLLTWKK